MITVTRTARGIRVEGADKQEAISAELLAQIYDGKSAPVFTYEPPLLSISDDFGNVYTYLVNPTPVMNGSAVFYNMERQL